ncbi:MAG TPA: DUF2062 domain-containing protein [Fibrobacteria bacterium]|nr:DUF2062 domain-containing protein [Fibrobacteria bacterium]
MKRAHRRKPLNRPWWRAPLRYMLRVRPRRRHVHGTLVHRLLGEKLFEPSLWIPNREAVAHGMAWGTFAGFLPLPGQSIVAVLLCYALRGNIATAVLATFLSNPLTTPAIWWLQFKLGRWLLPLLRWMETDEYREAGRSVIQYGFSFGKPFLLGSLVSAVVLGLAAYPLTLWVWDLVEAAALRRRKRRASQRAAEAAEHRAAAKDHPKDGAEG